MTLDNVDDSGCNYRVNRVVDLSTLLTSCLRKLSLADGRVRNAGTPDCG